MGGTPAGRREGIVVRRAAGFYAVTALVAGFAGGFLFCGWCLAEGLKDGSLDDLIDRVREKYPR